MGILGVNLIHAALYEAGAGGVVKQLLDDLSSERIEVDLIEFSGPAFAQVDNRLMSLELVHCGLSDAAMFKPRARSSSRPRHSTSGRSWSSAAGSGR